MNTSSFATPQPLQPASPRPIDQLIEARWIVPVEPANVVLEDHALALDGGKIVALLPIVQAREQFAPAKTTTLPHHILTPGLVNLHTHSAMALLRGIGDDMPLETWLNDRIWPIEKAVMSHAFVLAGTRHACLEMLRGGTTCFNDMYFFPDAAAEAALEIGMRAVLGITVIDFPTVWASDPDDYLQKGLAVRDALRDEELISFSLAPHAPYTVGDRSLTSIATLSEQLGLPINIHLHETRHEVESALAQSGRRPLERLAGLGLVGPQLIAVHAVHISTSELRLLAQQGATLAHCPASNLKLASGIAPIAEALDLGLRVGIGTDGAASNNRLDMLAEMRLAALLAKGTSGRADVFPSHAVLRAATLDGATALGLERKIGSLIAGKQADLAAFDLSATETQPCFDPVSHLLFAAGRESASDVWVNGQHVVEMRQLKPARRPDTETINTAAVSLWQNQLGLELARRYR